MANAQHTPGPWKLINPAADHLAVGFASGNNVAEWPTNYTPRDLADAQLIAAAPELLAACRAVELLVDGFREGRIGRHELANLVIELSGSQVREAITRTEGA